MVLDMVLMLVVMLALVVRRAKAQKAAESLDLSRVLPPSPAKKVHQHILHIVTYGDMVIECGNSHLSHLPAGYQFADADNPTAVTGSPAAPATVE